MNAGAGEEIVLGAQGENVQAKQLVLSKQEKYVWFREMNPVQDSYSGCDIELLFHTIVVRKGA